MSAATLLETALNCVKRGWFIFPLNPRMKTPNLELVPHWSQDSSNDQNKVREWWTKSPDANIGIDLGKSNLTVLDFDAGDPPLNIGLPKTFTIRTGRGQHLYFQGTVQQIAMHFGGKHVGEVKSAGGYVVGPRSLHPSGSTYEPVDQSSVAPLPTYLLSKLEAIRKPVDPSPDGEKIPYGSHYNELLRIAGYLRGKMGLGEEGLYTCLLEVCEKRCENYGGDYLEMCQHLASEMAKKPYTNTEVYVGSSRQQQQPEQQEASPENFGDFFRSFDQLEDGDVRMLINGFLPEGVNLIGGLAGQGKTLFALSLVKSLTSGKPFLGKFQPEELIPVIYMIPESSARAFKQRCRKFGITKDPELFLCRTITEGPALMLDSPVLAEAVKKMKPLLILDTLPRFNEAGDENDAAANKKLVDDISKLRAIGCVGVLALHHATKSSADVSQTLENVLRGTGDLGAMADSVYGIRRDRMLYADGAGPMELEVRCLKPRDFDPPSPFRVAASYQSADGSVKSYVDEDGDFQYVESAAVKEAEDRAFIKAITADPSISREDLAIDLGSTERKIRTLAKRLGYERSVGRHGTWFSRPAKSTPTIN
jgi:Bifunctional DNA primase/polymerase, N-terminal/AAA domain